MGTFWIFIFYYLYWNLKIVWIFISHKNTNWVVDRLYCHSLHLVSILVQDMFLLFLVTPWLSSRIVGKFSLVDVALAKGEPHLNKNVVEKKEISSPIIL